MMCDLCEYVRQQTEKTGEIHYYYTIVIPLNRKPMAVATEHEYPDASRRMRMLNVMRRMFGPRSEFFESGPPHFYIEVVNLVK